MESKSLLESDTDGFKDISSEMKFVLDLNGDILEMNETAYGSLQEKYSSFYDYFHPAHRDSVFHFIQRVYEKGIVKGVKLFHLVDGENVATYYNGKYDHDRLFLAGALDNRVLVGDGDNHKILTDLFKLDDKDMAVREFINSKLDLSILIVDQEGKIEFCNHRFRKLIELQSAGEEIGKKLYELDTVHPLKKFLGESIGVVKEKGIMEEQFFDEGDSLYQVQGMYYNEDDTIYLFIHDRSYQQRFEKLLIYKQQMESVSQLAAGVAHELRNPLSVIRGFLQLSSLTNDWKKYYDTILSELTRMNDIIEDFLSVSRKKISKKRQQPEKIFQSLVYIIRSECLLHNIIFEYDIEESSRETEVNEAMIKQVLLNLLRNSIEAYDEQKDHRRFILHTKETETNYIVEVTDFGPGMPKDVLKQLGKPFFTTKESGNGIGIPLCKNIIENHGGEFHIDSEQGEGTKITFSLPLVD